MFSRFLFFNYFLRIWIIKVYHRGNKRSVMRRTWAPPLTATWKYLKKKFMFNSQFMNQWNSHTCGGFELFPAAGYVTRGELCLSFTYSVVEGYLQNSLKCFFLHIIHFIPARKKRTLKNTFSWMYSATLKWTCKCNRSEARVKFVIGSWSWIWSSKCTSRNVTCSISCAYNGISLVLLCIHIWSAQLIIWTIILNTNCWLLKQLPYLWVSPSVLLHGKHIYSILTCCFPYFQAWVSARNHVPSSNFTPNVDVI